MKLELDFKADDSAVRIRHDKATAEFASGVVASLADAAAVLAGFNLPAGPVEYFVVAIARPADGPKGVDGREGGA